MPDTNEGPNTLAIIKMAPERPGACVVSGLSGKARGTTFAAYASRELGVTVRQLPDGRVVIAKSAGVVRVVCEFLRATSTPEK